MDSHELTVEQASQLHTALFSHLNYLLRLKKRMQELRFPDDDPLYLSVTAAYDAVWRLRQQTHGLSTPMGCRGRNQ